MTEPGQVETNGGAVAPYDADGNDTVARGLAVVEGMQNRIRAQGAEIDKLRFAEKCNTVEIQALHARVNALGSEVETLKMERDQAMRERAQYEGLFSSLKVQIDAFEMPSELPVARRAVRYGGKNGRTKSLAADLEKTLLGGGPDESDVQSQPGAAD